MIARASDANTLGGVLLNSHATAVANGVMLADSAVLHIGIATATWRKRLATRGTSRGPKKCYDHNRGGLCGVWH